MSQGPAVGWGAAYCPVRSRSERERRRSAHSRASKPRGRIRVPGRHPDWRPAVGGAGAI